jgi:N-acetylmuramoyl-L-alanine amidase
VEDIRFGQVGPAVADVQRRLADLGFACADDDGEFGESTRSAVRAFQQHRGLPADGVVGEDTWRSLVAASYRLGDRMLYVTRPLLHGDDIRELQRRLNRLGFDSGYDDGIYGAQTFEAVREFQLNVGLDVDGIAGPDSFDVLTRLHRQHQAAPAYVAREREQLRNRHRSSLAGARVMVDPGQGPGRTGVASPDGVPEHEVTWSIASLVEGRLAALGATVILGRGPTTTPIPSERAAHANTEDVEAILSIHVNHDGSPHARGASAAHFGTDGYVSEQGRSLAERAVDNIVVATGTAHCRVHPSTSALLRESRAPAVIVEVGFLTHPEEGRALTTWEHQHAIAGALVDAIAYFLLGSEASAA